MSGATSTACLANGAKCVVGRDECCNGSECRLDGRSEARCTVVHGSLREGQHCTESRHCASFHCETLPAQLATMAGLPHTFAVCTKGDRVSQPRDFAATPP